MDIVLDSRLLPLAERRQSGVLGRAALVFELFPLLWVALAWLAHDLPFTPAELRVVVPACIAASIAFALSAALLTLGSRIAFWVLPLGLGAALVPFAWRAASNPVVGFTAVSWGLIVAYLAFSQPYLLQRFRLPGPELTASVLSPAALLASGVAILVTSFTAGNRVLDAPFGVWATFGLLAAMAVLVTVLECLVAFRGLGRRGWAWGGVVLTGTGLACAPIPGLALTILGIRQLTAFIAAARAHELYATVVRFLWRRPALLVVLTFLSLALTGGVALTFPACTVRPIPELDALFTSTSACCVTGLTVLDTAVDFTFMGQIIILLLIQVGGLGIMTLAAVAILVVGGALPSEEESALADVVGASTPRATVRLVQAIAVGTFSIEAVGVLVLFPAFYFEGTPLLEAIWKSVFHSVSAFCNAGFALQSASLVPYQQNPVIIHTLGILIVLGGVGFGVLAGLHDWLRGRGRSTSLHVKLVVLTTAILLVGGAGLYLALEWNSSLAELSVPWKIQHAWFQSITPRTAGFNSVDMKLLRPATVFLLMALMFIGASPVSTGGGIKTTTGAVLLLAVRAMVRRSGEPRAFGRRIPTTVVYRAAAVATLSLTALFLGIFILLATQSLPTDAVAFEAVSAFGTVGLSLGITPFLDSVGKVVIIFLMLVGRTGPLTLVLLFQEQRPPRLRYPKEEVVVG